MRIDNWPINKIMQLPDDVFGRRYMVSMTAQSLAGAAAWDMAESPLPDKAVIWSMASIVHVDDRNVDNFRLALGNELPTTVAQMSLLDPIFPGLGIQGPEPRAIPHSFYMGLTIANMKTFVQGGGRKPILEVTGSDAANATLTVIMIVSSFPSEVDSWWISGPGKSQ